MKKPTEIKIYNSKFILKELNKSIVNKTPFSSIRLGDACGVVMGMVLENSEFFKFVDDKRGYNKFRSKVVSKRLNFEDDGLEKVCKRLVEYCNEANFIDCIVKYDRYRTSKDGFAMEMIKKWRGVYKILGIKNERYMDSVVNHLCLMEHEYNLVDVMKGRRVFFINNVAKRISKRFEPICKKVGAFDVQRRPKKQYDQLKKVRNLLKREVKNYDLFLIGAGMVGKIYCGHIKRCGGVAFDVGRVFKLWNGSNFRPFPLQQLIEANHNFTMYRKIR